MDQTVKMTLGIISISLERLHSSPFFHHTTVWYLKITIVVDMQNLCNVKKKVILSIFA